MIAIHPPSVVARRQARIEARRRRRLAARAYARTALQVSAAAMGGILSARLLFVLFFQSK